MLGGDDEIVSLRDEHFYIILAISKVVVAVIEGFFFDDLVGTILHLLHRIISRSISCLSLIESTTITRGTFILLPYYKIGLLISVFGQ